MIKMLMRRLEGYPDWKALGDVNWDIRRNGLTEFKRIPSEQKEVMRSQFSVCLKHGSD